MSVVVSRTVSADPARVFAMVSDLPRMGEWSPENRGGEWIKGATGPGMGARFKGRNSNGKRSWSTVVEVNGFDPGRRISFGLMVGPKNWCDWVWEVRPVEGGTEVRHEWIDHRGKVARYRSQNPASYLRHLPRGLPNALWFPDARGSGLLPPTHRAGLRGWSQAGPDSA